MNNEHRLLCKITSDVLQAIAIASKQMRILNMMIFVFLLMSDITVMVQEFHMYFNFPK